MVLNICTVLLLNRAARMRVAVLSRSLMELVVLRDIILTSLQQLCSIIFLALHNLHELIELWHRKILAFSYSELLAF